VVASYGNIDGQRLLNTSRKVPLALLTHYDYLQDPGIMALNPADGTVGVDGIGNTTRDWNQPTAYAQFALQGASNEGYDVPGYQDPWLAHQSFAGGQFTVKPSYHDPAVVNYISHLYGNPSSMSLAQVNEMLRLIDASSARINSYPGKNSGFRENDLSVVRLPQTFTWTTPTPTEILTLQNFVRNQIMGPWDVDNDGDGIADSVWIDPGMQVVFAPDGRRLRPLAAILIEDLDGRVNLNTAGDRVHGNAGFDAQTNTFYKRPNQIVPQGFGYGPAEISLTRLFQPNSAVASPLLFSDAIHFSFFDELAGARRHNFRPINFALVNDRVPGIPRSVAYPDPSFSALSER
ncbi:MAG TPA: hypothetical protein VM260_00255, partial [Pirellula sp.]|nr:hypothetical protein [Pirellula sp.]